MSSLATKELNQLSEETGLSKVSIQDWHKRFMQECPTGNISKERYINLYRSYYPRARNADIYAQMLFTAFDDDRDQALNFREFLRVVTVSQGTDEKAKLELAYKAYNRNQSETNLSRKELQNAIIAILNLVETQDDTDENNDTDKRQRTIDWVMRRVGLDEKTEITKKEFIRRCKGDPNLYEFLAFHSVPKPNCSDGDLRGKEKYKIDVKTGTEGKKLMLLKAAGTDANVYLMLHGEKATSESILLQHSQTHKDPFEHGHTDVFTQFLPSLGKIKGATLWHTGDKSQGWYVEDIMITNETLNKSTYFPVQRWLDADGHDNKTKVELIPNQPPGYAQ
jgi:Ca2+-binding EF-hand superfamily protein